MDQRTILTSNVKERLKILHKFIAYNHMAQRTVLDRYGMLTSEYVTLGLEIVNWEKQLTETLSQYGLFLDELGTSIK